MRLRGEASEILAELARRWPGAPAMPGGIKRKVLDYQMTALWALAREFDRAGARILEIGTGHGGSGTMLAMGAPQAEILSLTIDENGAANARRLWKSAGLGNIRVEIAASWDYLKGGGRRSDGSGAPRSETMWDMVWIDGDHNQIRRDLPWFDRVVEGGLLVCHDYSPENSRTPSAICFEALNEMAAKLGRPFDVELIDDGLVGMVGFYRRPGERWA